MKFYAIQHSFVPVKQVNNVVLAKCTCCQIPRWGVFIAVKNDRIFRYHGFSETEAERTFDFLVRRQAQLQQIQ